MAGPDLRTRLRAKALIASGRAMCVAGVGLQRLARWLRWVGDPGNDSLAKDAIITLLMLPLLALLVWLVMSNFGTRHASPDSLSSALAGVACGCAVELTYRRWRRRRTRRASSTR